MNFAKTIVLLFVIASAAKQSHSQGTWVQKTNFGGGLRNGAVGFAIGSKGYIGTGFDGIVFYQDLWEWDQITNTWTQKANFLGTKRGVAVGFSIANKGYVGTGYDAANFQNDLWEYDPFTNSWTQKASLPFSRRRRVATGFSIGHMGYITIGEGISGFNYIYLPDLWEYDALNNTWLQKANFPASSRSCAASFSIGNKGYVGIGHTHTSVSNIVIEYNDFWEWDQGTDTWTQKANYPGPPRGDGVAFSIGNFGYMGTGTDWWLNNVYSDFFQYSPTNNIWLPMDSFAGGIRGIGTGFSIGCKGYVGIGVIPQFVNKNDFWEFTPPAPSAAMAGINTICSGDSTSLFASGGLFYQWSTGETTMIIDVRPTVTTAYSVVVSDGCGSSTASMQVTVIPTPVANFSSQLNLCDKCAEFTNNSVNGITYAWNFGDSATSTSQNNNHCYADTGTYSTTLIVYSATGMCRDTASANVTFYDPDETQVIVPNVFTPNGDGINDVFKISGLDKCEPYSIKIYDRWGNLIFATEKTGLGWDGRTTTGVNSQSGVYYYTLTNSLTTRKGVVTLLR